MNSRDRTRSSSFANKLESDLEEFLKENETLKQIQAKRREEAISDKLDDEKPLEDVLSSVFKSSSVLSKLFILGEKLKNPINLGPGSEAEVFEGKYNPTFFTLIRPKKKTEVPFKREAQIGRKCRIRFKTDACNDFFNMENIHLQSELKPIAKNEAKMKLLKARYKYSMVLIGLSILGYGKNHHDPENEQKSEIEEPEQTVRLVTRMLSPIILPMIAVMGDDLGDIID